MAYTPDYTADDVAPIVIDGLGVILITVIAFAGIVALILLWRWVRGKKLMPK